MQELLVRTRGNAPSKDMPRVYLACHPDDFERCFEKVSADLFEAADCALFYRADMTEPLPEETRALDLGRMNLFVFPVTFRFLSEPSAAREELAFAKESGALILPLMFDIGIDPWYSLPENFGTRQYLAPFSSDPTEVPYPEKLKLFLSGTLLDPATISRIRKSFDAYIFLSYRKADRVFANELIRLIHAEPRYRDIAVWFDEFLTPGEAFDEKIGEALDLSRVFALTVTPTLTKYTPEGRRNYVMENEYPMAKRAAEDPSREHPLRILPVQMSALSGEEDAALQREFAGLPALVNGFDPAALQAALYEQLKDIALAENDRDPEHNYMIGLAYLEGIDVETDPKRGVGMITAAAEAGFLPAMEKLSELYHAGRYVRLNWREDLKWRERLYEGCVRLYGEEDQRTVRRLNNLASILGELGDYPRQLELNEKAYALYRRVFGEDDPETLISLSNLAGTYGKLGDHARAIELDEQAYETKCRTLGEEHPSTLSSLNNLALDYMRSGDCERARELAEKAYEAERRTLGEEHPSTLTSLNNLAGIADKLGDHQRALEWNREIYLHRTRILGKEHPHTLISLNNLAFSYVNTGDYPRAEELFRKAYERRVKILGEAHPDTLTVLDNLAFVTLKQGEYSRGMPLLLKEHELYRRLYGPEDPKTLFCLYKIARMYEKSGDLRAAYERMGEVYALRSHALGEHHPDTEHSLEILMRLAKKIDEN